MSGRCPSCRHGEHWGLCTARSGGTAYACMCSKQPELPRPPTVREAARRRQPLDGADAQALEGALSLTERERDAALSRETKLREVIRRYGRHDDGNYTDHECREYRDGPDTCDCGFDEAVWATEPKS